MTDAINITIDLPSGCGGSLDIDRSLYEIMGPERVGEQVGQFVVDVLRRDAAKLEGERA